MGILCDGQMMLGDAIQRVFDLANGTAEPIERTSGRKVAKAVKPAAARRTIAAVKNMLNPNNNSINMKEKYPSLFAALQVEEMQMQDGGAFMNEELLANLNAAIETAQKEKADALALVDSLKADHATAIENLNAEHQQAIDQLNEQLTAKGDELAAAQQANADLNEQVTNLTAKNEEQATQIEQLNTELTGAKESLTTAEGQLAEKDQTIADLNAQVEELQAEPGAAPQAGASPKNNGAGADAPQVVVNRYVYNNELTYEQNCEAEERWNKEHGL
jgi:chromosome segregation ATPase